MMIAKLSEAFMTYSQVNERMCSNTDAHNFNLLFYKTGKCLGCPAKGEKHQESAK